MKVKNIKIKNLFKTDLYGSSYLLAVSKNNIKTMKYIEKQILNKNSYNIDYFDKEGNNAYLIAAKEGYLDVIKHLETFHDDKDIHVKNKNGYDAFLLASRYGHVDVVKYLKETYDWDIYGITTKNYNAMFLASCGNKHDVISYLDNVCNWNHRNIKNTVNQKCNVQ